MQYPKTHCFLLLLLSLQFSLHAQDKLNIKFGKVKPEDFDVKSALIDSSTNAVVVADVGNSEFIANTTEFTFSLIFRQSKRIKIINKNGFDAATITIPLYVSDENKAERLEQLSAYTYNLEDGKVVETKVDKSSIFTEKKSKNWIYKKFTFPALKEGSIIEYTCEIKSDFFFNLQSWTFQGKYPVLWSQYEAAIPDFYKFVILSQGYRSFFINKVVQSQKSFSFTERQERTGGGGYAPVTSGGVNVYNVDGSIDYHTWIMKDVPAIKEEPYTTTIRNAITRIEFQLNQVAFPHTVPTNYMDTWEKVATDLMSDEKFGLPIGRANNWLDDEVESMVKKAGTPLEKAQKIFEYVRDNFAYNDHEGIYITTGLKDVFKTKAGSVSDLNMLLIAMLKNQKIETYPVILSTRDNGYAHEFYPLINRYNYVIAKAVIGQQEIYLDASVPDLAFGRLPDKVYNGQAREISNNMASPVYFVADSLKESGMTNVFIANMDKGGVEGMYSHTLGFYESMNLRDKMRKSMTEEYKKSQQAEFSEDIELENPEIDSLKIPDMPVSVKFDLKLKAFDGDADIVYFNPVVGAAIKKNPFTAAQRFFPVEMPYTIDDTYTFHMEVPKGYKIDELPKSARFSLNEDEGMFEYLISGNEAEIQMRCRLKLNKATYANEDYDSIREFYSYIVKKESEQIAFKKIK